MRIAPGIHRLGPDSIVNSYLVEEGGEATIIDAGLPGLWAVLPTELAAMRRTVADVRAIVLTHGHSDHVGYAERARKAHRWPVWVHEIDAPLARGEVGNPAKGGGPMKPGSMIAFLWWTLRHGGLRVTHLGEVATYGDGAPAGPRRRVRRRYRRGRPPGAGGAAARVALRGPRGARSATVGVCPHPAAMSPMPSSCPGSTWARRTAS